jgi:Fe-S cluster biogenesis protein NfuA
VIDLDDVLERMEMRLGEVDGMDEPARTAVFDLLEGVDAVHRLALQRLAGQLDPVVLDRCRSGDPAVDWLLSAYGVGVDERAVAEAALDTVRPYVSSHGGRVELLDVADGRVRVRMSGSCSGCTASAVTVHEGIENALREGLPSFFAIEVEQDDAAAHAPPTETFVELGRKSA